MQRQHWHETWLQPTDACLTLGGSRSCWARRHRPGRLTARQYGMFIATCCILLPSKFTIIVRKIEVIYTVPFSLWSYGKLALILHEVFVCFSRDFLRLRGGKNYKQKQWTCDLERTASTHPRTLKLHGHLPVTYFSNDNKKQLLAFW